MPSTGQQIFLNARETSGSRRKRGRTKIILFLDVFGSTIVKLSKVSRGG